MCESKSTHGIVVVSRRRISKSPYSRVKTEQTGNVAESPQRYNRYCGRMEWRRNISLARVNFPYISLSYSPLIPDYVPFVSPTVRQCRTLERYGSRVNLVIRRKRITR